MRRNYLLAPLVSLILIGCSAERGHSCATCAAKGHDHPPAAAEGSTAEHGPAEHGHAEGQKLVLNDGQKWETDEHTRTIFATMRARLDSELSGKELGAALEGDLQKLIQGCTMPGEAHKQLHVFLMGYLPAVAHLSESGHEHARESVVSLLDEYPKYFQ